MAPPLPREAGQTRHVSRSQRYNMRKMLEPMTRIGAPMANCYSLLLQQEISPAASSVDELPRLTLKTLLSDRIVKRSCWGPSPTRRTYLLIHSRRESQHGCPARCGRFNESFSQHQEGQELFQQYESERQAENQQPRGERLRRQRSMEIVGERRAAPFSMAIGFDGGLLRTSPVRRNNPSPPLHPIGGTFCAISSSKTEDEVDSKHLAPGEFSTHMEESRVPYPTKFSIPPSPRTTEWAIPRTSLGSSNTSC